ncbi:S8 family serine peptidase [Streptomyces armeniacus]|nr:S8 family serine peptidase [Streptomyces armeniacus]
MQAEEMWKVSTGKGMKVAVVDTGVNDSTPSLRGQVLPGKDTSNEPGDENVDPDSHGTTMAELIAGTGDGAGIKGLAPDAKIISIRAALKKKGQTVDWSKSGNIDESIRAAADSEAQIINLSFASEYYTPHLQDAVKYAVGKGKLVFAGVGNDGDGKNKSLYPASLEEAVAVAAVDESAKATEFSQHGGYVDLAAPGKNLPGWCPGQFDRYCTGGYGTSQATALASASAALIWSKHKDWTANQVLRVMMETAGKPKDGKVPSTRVGYGVVRPNDVLLKGKGDPGDPGKHPLDIPEPGESPSTSPSTGSGNNDDKGAADKVNVADSTESDDDSKLGLILGTGAAVAVLAVGAFAFVRMRRR